jgi:CheY-like chemotaxis protein
MILLIDDDSDDVFFLERSMKKANPLVQLYTLNNGKKALDYLEGTGTYGDRSTHPLPSGILLDLKMPKVHGFDVLRWIRQQPSLRQIPVIIFSGTPSEADREKARQMGADGFFIEPVNPDKWVEIFKLLSKLSPSV